MYAKCVEAGQCTPLRSDSSYTRASYYGNSAYDDFPVINVSWDQAAAYCAWAGRRLPTEAEWEYAARGGLAGKLYPWGDEAPVCDLGAVNGAHYGVCSPNDTIAVRSFTSNGYDLYDMAGNVWEWVNDWYGEYPSGSVTDPAGPIDGSRRALRGGSWLSYNDVLRVAGRNGYDPASTYYSIGFRCASSP
jgi:formylglycine-generating enzyme required for sulfatase activity